MGLIAREPDGLFVDGGWVQPVDGVTEAILNPATEAVLAHAPVGGPAEVEAALAAARRAFDDGPWPRMSAAERAVVLRRFADELDKRTEDLVALVVAEAGSAQAVARLAHVEMGLTLFRTAVELSAHREPMV